MCERRKTTRWGFKMLPLNDQSRPRSVLPPRSRLLSRVQAAGYVGVSPTTFDRMMDEGSMPKPKRIFSRKVWDVRKLDSAIDALPSEDDADDNPWDN